MLAELWIARCGPIVTALSAARAIAFLFIIQIPALTIIPPVFSFFNYSKISLFFQYSTSNNNASILLCLRDGRVVKPAMPVLFAFMGPVGLLAWRWVCVSLHCENRRFRNGQRKQIIRTHLLLETSSDYIGLVREAGLEPARA